MPIGGQEGERSGDAGVSELNLLAEVRQARMAGIIWDEGLRVSDLADRFGVSVTVRADLTALEARACAPGPGGAVPPSPARGAALRIVAVARPPPEGQHRCARRGQGDRARRHRDPGRRHDHHRHRPGAIPRTDLRDVTVVTNGLNIALELERG